MTSEVRAQLGAWGRRYRGTAVGVLLALAVVLVFPSVAPVAGDLVSDGLPVATPVAPGTATPPTTSTTTAATAGTGSPAPSSGESPTADGPAPGGVAPPTVAPPPARPEPLATPCPLHLPRASTGTEPLPLADVLNIASPVLPLLGPFVPYALAGTPLVEPVLPVVTPLLPVAEPVYVNIGPVVGNLAGPLVEFEALLLMPIEAPLAEYSEQMLAAEKQFIEQLQPVLDSLEGTGAPDCGVIVTASLGGLLLDIEDSLPLDSLLRTILDLLR